MDRVDGVTSRDIITWELDDSVREALLRGEMPADAPAAWNWVNQRTVDELKRIRQLMEQHQVAISDFEFMVRSDGSVVIVDLERGVDVARPGYEGLVEMTVHLLDQDIETLQQIVNLLPSGTP
jgi:preprotein translocase subunit SecA